MLMALCERARDLFSPRATLVSRTVRLSKTQLMAELYSVHSLDKMNKSRMASLVL